MVAVYKPREIRVSGGWFPHTIRPGGLLLVSSVNTNTERSAE